MYMCISILEEILVLSKSHESSCIFFISLNADQKRLI